MTEIGCLQAHDQLLCLGVTFTIAGVICASIGFSTDRDAVMGRVDDFELASVILLSWAASVVILLLMAYHYMPNRPKPLLHCDNGAPLRQRWFPLLVLFAPFVLLGWLLSALLTWVFRRCGYEESHDLNRHPLIEQFIDPHSARSVVVHGNGTAT